MVKTVFKGGKTAPSLASVLIDDYLTRMTLSKIGYNFGGDDLTDFEAQYLSLIGSTIAGLMADQAKKAAKKIKGRARK